MQPRHFTVTFVILILFSFACHAGAKDETPPSPATADTLLGHDDVMRTGLEAIRRKHDLPALGGAIVTAMGLDGVWVTGTRTAGGREAVTADDLWHLGSCTKSMTATVIALLVERGDLAWERTLPELLPELAPAMDRAFADVTLVDLLAHRAGVRTMTGPDDILERCSGLAVEPREQRRELARAVLSAPPSFPPRQDCHYSNAGFVIAGAIVERATGKPWEESIQELLFRPLGIMTAGFGAPGAPDQVDQPRGHDNDGKPVRPGPDGDNAPIIGPAGTVHMSLADWARYLQLHLRGVTEDVMVGAITLRAATIARLHTPWPAQDTRYGYGWALPQRDWAGGDHTVLTHAGSNTMWYSVCWLDPATGFGVLVTTNAAGEKATRGTDEAAARLLQDWFDREKAATAVPDK